MTDNTVKMTINCNGKLIDVSHPKIMGILNITPDSFFDGGHYNDTTSILKQVEKMLLEGATFIDVGACSSRPGSMAVTEEEEMRSQFGDVYDLYAKRTPRFFPNLSPSSGTPKD